MKHVATIFSGPVGLLRLCRRQLVQRLGAWVLLLGFLPLATGGCNYYRTQPQAPEPAALSQLAARKLFLVHEGAQTWQLVQPRLDGQTLVGTRAAPAPELQAFLDPTPQASSRRYRIRQRETVLNLVHLYLAPTAAPGATVGSEVRLPLASVQRIDIVDTDSGRTIASHVVGAIGGALAIVVIIGIIIALTKSSCPFVYAHDGRAYRFVGEAYGGAIFAPHERPDYLPLPAAAPSPAGEYRVKISNELKERQYTNLAELLVAEHPAGTRLLLDSAGQPHTLRQPLPPLLATAATGRDHTAALQAPDHAAALFDDEPDAGAAPSQLTLRFARPLGAQAGKLVLRAQNSLWLDYLYGRFIEQFGSYYPTWAAQQHDPATATNLRWAQEQQVPLRVYCRTATGWQLAGTVPPVGPLAARDLVVPLRFGPGHGPVEILLQTGFRFWEIDYAALDCTPDEPVRLARCTPLEARTERGTDERAALLADDDQYLRQLRPGTEVQLVFRPAPPAAGPGQQRTVYLHTKGYYEHIRDFRGLPNLPQLLSFRRPGRFVEFSREVYREQATPALTLAATR